MQRTRVLIADDERSAALELAVSLSSQLDIAYVGTADCLRSAIDLTRALEPDVVVMSLRLDDGAGISATAELKQRFPTVRVIVLTNDVDTELVPRAAAARASALLQDTGQLSEMLEVIRHEDSDECYVNPRVYNRNASVTRPTRRALARVRPRRASSSADR